MEPVFTLPYSEFCVAQQLARHLPASRGYSLCVPISRQQLGVDLILTRRRAKGSRVASIQVKSSRTYSDPPRKKSKNRSFQYYTWFNTFECPTQADFFCLVTLYPALDQAQHEELKSWWSPQILLFSQKDMRRFLRSVKTQSGKRDKMFGFGFDCAGEMYQTRGDSKKRYLCFKKKLLPGSLPQLRRFLNRKQ